MSDFTQDNLSRSLRDAAQTFRQKAEKLEAFAAQVDLAVEGSLEDSCIVQNVGDQVMSALNTSNVVSALQSAIVSADSLNRGR